jgi:hypothetical protein
LSRHKSETETLCLRVLIPRNADFPSRWISGTSDIGVFLTAALSDCP